MRTTLSVLTVLLLPLALGAQEVKPPVVEKQKVTEKKVDEKKVDEKKADEKKVDDKQDEKKVVVEQVYDDILPLGSDPEDLAAMQGALEMLEAERKLAELLKNGDLAGVDKIVPFEEISAWPYEEGLKGMPEALNGLNGKSVMMTGFMLPIDEVENIREFLLVPSLWSCCYGQPPDINGTVRVVMKGDKRINYKFDPIKILGTFKIEATYEMGFCVDIFQIEADSVDVIR
jgi:hypothetical protein